MKIERCTLKLFFCFFIFYIFIMSLLIITPFKSSGGGQLIFLINFVFFILFYLPALFISTYSFSTKIEEELTLKQIAIIKKNIKFCFWFSLAGVALIFYDRVFLRGIDYSVGLRAARYQWLNSPGGNFFGVLGNLLIPLSYVGLFLIVQHVRFLKLNRFVLYLSGYVMIITLHSLLNGGRSNVLLMLLMILFSFLLRQEKWSFKYISRYFILFCFVFIPVFLYVLQVIKSSASMGGATVNELLLLGAYDLYGQLKDGENVYKFSEIEALLNYAILYLVHGQWTMGIVFADGPSEGSYFLYPFSVLLSKILPLNPLETGRFSDTGAFTTLPAAIYYDFGVFGVFVVLLLSFLFGFALSMLRNRSRVGGARLAVIVYLCFIFMLAPVVPAFGFSYLNFILFAFVFVGIVNYVFYGRGARFL